MVPDRNNPAKTRAVVRALFDMQDSQVPLKDLIRAADTAISQYQRGEGITDFRAREGFTHPDFVEAAEMLAERFRVMLFEDEEMTDKVTDLATEIYTGGLDELSDEDIHQWESMAWGVVLSMVRPLIMRVLDTGDWNPEKED